MMSLRIINLGNEPICLDYARLGYFDYAEDSTVDMGQRISEYPFMNYSDKFSVRYHLGRCETTAYAKPIWSACTIANRWSGGMTDCTILVYPPNRYGTTTILNHDTDKGRHDVLRFAEGIDVGDIDLIRWGDNLHLDFRDEAEVITVLNYFKGDAMAGYALNAIEFADGTSWDIEYVTETVRQGSERERNPHVYSTVTSDTVSGIDGIGYIHGEKGDDELSRYQYGRSYLSSYFGIAFYGYAGKDNLYGGQGADWLYGGADDDVLYGGEGSDVLYGQAGDDVLHSNIADSDYLEGGAGDDVYLFQLGALHCNCLHL